MRGETLREALFRHLEKDLGPMAFPQLPASPVPFQVAEYFPMPGITPFTDDRQHAVSLAYVVPVTGTCEPRQDALELTWMTPEEAASITVSEEMEGGRASLSRGRGKNSACNIINAKYTSARHDYQQVDMDTWIDQDNIDLRGEELSVDLDLSWAPAHGQARRSSSSG